MRLVRPGTDRTCVPHDTIGPGLADRDLGGGPYLSPDRGRVGLCLRCRNGYSWVRKRRRIRLTRRRTS